jgi:hypothetical protein
MSIFAQIEQVVREAVKAALAEVLEKLTELEGRLQDLEDQMSEPAPVAGAKTAKAVPGRNVRAQAETAHAKGSAS